MLVVRDAEVVLVSDRLRGPAPPPQLKSTHPQIDGRRTFPGLQFVVVALEVAVFRERNLPARILRQTLVELAREVGADLEAARPEPRFLRVRGPTRDGP